MSSLTLQLREGETLIINGASIHFRGKTTINLTTRARFLFGKQIMSSAAANTPVRHLYLALQAAYIGSSEQERTQGLKDARALTAALKRASASEPTRDILDRALAAAEADDGYTALRLARQLVRLEDVALGRASRKRWHSEVGKDLGHSL